MLLGYHFIRQIEKREGESTLAHMTNYWAAAHVC